jgi:hypothetical protein
MVVYYKRHSRHTEFSFYAYDESDAYAGQPRFYEAGNR